MNPFLLGTLSLFLACVGVVTFLGVQLNQQLQVQNQPATNSDANNFRPTQPPAIISQPTSHPTTFMRPTIQPAISGSSITPTISKNNPTISPSTSSTATPTKTTTITPSFKVTSSPSITPTVKPTTKPTITPTLAPTTSPTSLSPTKSPTPPPTAVPSIKPTVKNTSTPTKFPTASPTVSPSIHPSVVPTHSPSALPSTISPTFQSTHPPTTGNILTSTAAWTYYDIYPKCCEGEPNYDPSYPTTECIEDNGCAHPGLLAALGYRPINFVETHNLIAFYDNSDPYGTNFYTKYGAKNITITGTCNGTSKTFIAVIADTCGNSDCSNCCQKNADSQTGYLIDMDYYTVMSNFGSTSCAEGTVEFSINLDQPPPTLYCGAAVGGYGCSSQYCCGANGVCGSGSSYCETGCQSEYGNCASNSGTCGADGNVCQNGNCCSQFGYCGNTTAFCGIGCLPEYGQCNTPAPTLLPTPAPTLLSTRAPLV